MTLDDLVAEVQRVIVTRQHPVTGLLPASTAVNQHGDYTDAWVRDNVYSVLAVWGAAMALQRSGDSSGRGLEFEYATVRLMRGLLRSMLRQAHKVEAFKHSQDPADALHAKYATDSGDPVVDDAGWGHLQLDATSLWLLMLAQMTASGLSIVQSVAEVRFVQNLVYYVGRAYRTPDYGIWERGDKTNHGQSEVNASSVGMAKAALEALDGLNLYGPRGGQASVIHVQRDDIARARVTLEAMLPRESASKEVDAALLSIVGYPAFAVDDSHLAERTRRHVVERLRGRYGLKRFLRDGHQTAVEDPSRLHYEPHELERFEHIEAEWPLFEGYLALDALFRGDRRAATDHLQALDRLALEVEGQRLLPELYLVPEEAIAAERAAPGSQARTPGDNLPLVWAQSLWLLARMLQHGYLRCSDLDPLGRHRFAHVRASPVVQLALVSDDDDVIDGFAALGVLVEQREALEPLRVRHADALARALTEVGRHDQLGLSGRPLRRPQSLATSRAYRLQGEPYVFLPGLLDPQASYLALDPDILIARLRVEIAYLQRHWTLFGRPTVVIAVGRDHLEHGSEALAAFLAEARSGSVDGVPVRLGRLRELLLVTNEERVDDLGAWRDEPRPLIAGSDRPQRLPAAPNSRPIDPGASLALDVIDDPERLAAELAQSSNRAEQVDILRVLTRRWGRSAWLDRLNATVEELLEDAYRAAADARDWAVLRQVTGLLGRPEPSLGDALSDLLAAQRRVVVGRAYADGATVTRPLTIDALMATIARYCRDDPRDQALTQELIVALASLIRGEPELFRGILTVRVGHLIRLLAVGLADELGVAQAEGYERLMACAPAEVVARLRRVLSAYDAAQDTQRRVESLRVAAGAIGALTPTGSHVAPAAGWWRWRQQEGTLMRVARGFYPRVWDLLAHTDAIVIGDVFDRRNRLDSAAERAATTSGERTFAQRVEHLLHRIPAPEYRRLSVEVLETLAAVTAGDEQLRLEGTIALDVVIGHAVRHAWLERHGPGLDEAASDSYERHTADAWAAFYDMSPTTVAGYVAAALRYLSVEGSAPRNTTSVH